MSINFVPSVDYDDSEDFKDSNKPRIIYTNSDNAVVMIGCETDEIIEKLFKSLLERYQKGLEEKMGEGSNYVLDSVDLLNYNLYKISLNRGRSYIDSPKWLRNKKAKINPKNKDEKCFQYAITVVLNYQKINNHCEEIYNITTFIDQYDWNEISITQKRLE